MSFGGATPEYVVSNLASGSAISLSTGVAADVTSITVPAGDWDVSGNVFLEAQSTFAISTMKAYGQIRANRIK